MRRCPHNAGSAWPAAGPAHGSPPGQGAPGGVGIGPFLLDQAPVPREQRDECHDPVQPKVPGQQPRERGDHSTV